MSLIVKTKKEIQVEFNGYHKKYFVVHDLIKSTYQLSYESAGEFTRQNKTLFDETFLDEKSAINELIRCFEEFEPSLTPYP
ncbi:hypothetical protein [Photobacterium lucens]|uniref:hypothetical protein n=1 Tax=Photobacterium lucens TaxID=2562949 RepID=UPI00136D775F|nr:hypothetical protein [Photobacterium lucens]MBP2699731.1 hypothetical protein [Vibrio parahaemolyticus]MZG55129.1 hypothetical protein [Photobacterium lucens]MZG79168.1 hypothetical protein [Photobacterium lucens]